MRITPHLIVPIFFTALMTPAAAMAQAVGAEPAATDVAIEKLPAAQTIAAEIVPAENTNIVIETDLNELRGGESLVLGNQTLAAVSNGNSIGGDYTAGNVNISDSALSNFAGVGNIVINTGAQANLQAGMNLIINLVP
jgi:outer membrane receptor protein involved in Fe transport